MVLAAEKSGDSPIKSDIKLGPQTHLGAESQSYGTIQFGPKIMENGDNYSTAPWRNMRRSARGNLVQW